MWWFWLGHVGIRSSWLWFGLWVGHCAGRWCGWVHHAVWVQSGVSFWGVGIVGQWVQSLMLIFWNNRRACSWLPSQHVVPEAVQQLAAVGFIIESVLWVLLLEQPSSLNGKKRKEKKLHIYWTNSACICMHASVCVCVCVCVCMYMCAHDWVCAMLVYKPWWYFFKMKNKLFKQ